MKLSLIALFTLATALPTAFAESATPFASSRWRVIHSGQCTQKEVKRGCRSDWQCQPDRERCYRLGPGEGDVCVPDPGICYTSCFCR